MFIISQPEIVTLSVPEEFGDSSGQVQVILQFTVVRTDKSEDNLKSNSILTRDNRSIELFKTDRTSKIVRHVVHNATITNKDTVVHNVVASLSSPTDQTIELVNTTLEPGHKYIFNGKTVKIYDDTNLEVSSGSIPGTRFRQFEVTTNNKQFDNDDSGTQFIHTGERDDTQYILPLFSETDADWKMTIANLSIVGSPIEFFAKSSNTINGTTSVTIPYGAILNTVKDAIGNNYSIKSSLGALPSNHINVNSALDVAEDLDELSGVYTLKPGFFYSIHGNLDLGNNRVNTNGAVIYGSSLFLDSISYSGTGTMFTLDQVSFEMKFLTIMCPSGTFYNATGTSTQRLRVIECVILCNIIGDADSMRVIQFNQLAIISLTDGLSITGTGGSTLINTTSFAGFDGSGIYIDYGTSMMNTGEINTVRADVEAGETFLSGLVDGGNFAIGLIVIEGFFDDSGGGDILSGITVDDLNMDFRDNFGLPDSSQDAELFIADGDEDATIISTGVGDDGNPILVTGVWTEQVARRFTTDATGRATHLGLNSRDFLVFIQFNATPDSGNNITYQFYIAKNDTVIVATRSKRVLDSANPLGTTVVGVVNLDTDEYVELHVENKTNETDVTVDAANIVIT